MITPEEALAKWANVTDDDEPPTSSTPTPPPMSLKPPPRHYRPFSDAADAFIKESQNTKRFYTGIETFDNEMRGLSPGHLGVIVGYSHSGKTLLLLHMLKQAQNRNKRVALFEPDEPMTLTLAKFASLIHGIPARELEERVSIGDRDAITLLRSVAEEEFPNLIVFDKTLTPSVLNDGYKEACDVWGEAADLVIVDYVDLVQGADVVPQKFDILKSFVSNHEVPMWAIHQTSRSAGADGKEMTISSGNYGGEQHATMMIGVRRKKAGIMAGLSEVREKLQRNPNSDTLIERREELEHSLRIHEYTLSANLVKNKRPGGGLCDEIDFEMELDTGRLYQMEEGDLPRKYLERFGASAVPRTTDAPTRTQEEAF